MIEFLFLTEILTQYDVFSHVPSDILVDKPFIPPNKSNMQSYLNEVSEWSKETQMIINETKANYFIY